MQDMPPKIHRTSFPKDVLINWSGTYGGPEACCEVIADQQDTCTRHRLVDVARRVPALSAMNDQRARG